MQLFRRARRGALTALAVGIASLVTTQAQTPGEVSGLAVQANGDLTWDAVSGADVYNVYRAVGSGASPMGAIFCFSPSVAGTLLPNPPDPEPGHVHAFLVTGESITGGEGPPGVSSSLAARHLQGACGPRMRVHVLGRAGYGWNEWSRNRIAELGGMDAYLNEQLDPAQVDEDSNFTLSLKLSAYEPPADGIDLIARHVLYSVYARRQLEHRMASFWLNHFNTDWSKLSTHFRALFPSCFSSSEPSCDESYPARAYAAATALVLRDFEIFRDLAFQGDFRQMVEAATLSPAMLIYLDLHLSVVGTPNENQPRELLELHSMGVNGGYTQQDVEELSRLMTGWTVCRKATTDVDDPLAPCIADYWLGPGEWTANFDITRHDCTPKVLFQGMPHEVRFPGTPTCSSASDATAALAELDQALDAIVAHPATAEFISRKIVELLITDAPTPQMVNTLVTAWNNPGHPQGIGDLREITRAAVFHPAFLSPQYAGAKVKTPLEQFVSSFRALRGSTDGLAFILSTLTEAQHIPFFNEVPTGYPEQGGDWVGTGGTLVRQNWGIRVGTFPISTTFSTQPVALLNANGISTAPGNAPAIVDFLAEVLFGGNITPAERQIAIEYLNSNSSGFPGPYDDDRIRETVGLLLGYPQFQEQ